jgi:hypothetical protein
MCKIERELEIQKEPNNVNPNALFSSFFFFFQFWFPPHRNTDSV